MNPTEKLTTTIKNMWNRNVSWCHHLGALRLVIENECEPSPALADLKAQVEQMQAMCQKLCVGYDNLRALAGRLEVEQDITKPRFWCGEINTTDMPTRCQRAGKVKR